MCLDSQGITQPRVMNAEDMEEAWAELKPDVIFHIRYPHFPTLFPDLIKYMQTKNCVLMETLDTGSYPVDIWFRPGYVPPGRPGLSYNGLLTGAVLTFSGVRHADLVAAVRPG